MSLLLYVVPVEVVVRGGAAPHPAKHGAHDSGREALPHQVLIEPGELRPACRLRSAAKLLLHRALDEGAFVPGLEYLRDRSSGGCLIDAARQDLADAAQSSAAFHFHC